MRAREDDQGMDEPPTKKPAMESPLCRNCGGTAQSMRVKSGANEGRHYWGCRATPTCRGFLSWIAEESSKPAPAPTPSPVSTSPKRGASAVPSGQRSVASMFAKMGGSKQASLPIPVRTEPAPSSSASSGGDIELMVDEDMLRFLQEVETPSSLAKPSPPTKKSPLVPTSVPLSPSRAEATSSSPSSGTPKNPFLQFAATASSPKTDRPGGNPKKVAVEEEAVADTSAAEEVLKKYVSGGSSQPPPGAQESVGEKPTPKVGTYREMMSGVHQAGVQEERYRFLEDVKDAQGRRPGEEGYDGRTLFIPPTVLKNMTAFEQQFWEIKSQHYDKVVFFKKGKFYEMYEMDADIGHQYLNLKMSGDNRAHMRMTGVPEASFDGYASKLVAQGFKVVRVDQAESKVARDRRVATETRGEESIIQREISAVLSAGTLVDDALLQDSKATYLLALVESGIAVGVCLVDASTGEFLVGQFDDDGDRSQLQTLLIQLQPREVLYEKGVLPSATLGMLKRLLQFPTLNARQPLSEFWDSDRTLQELQARNYFASPSTKNLDSARVPSSEYEHFPEELKTMITQDPSRMPRLALSAFGAVVSYLTEMHLDQELLRMRRVRRFESVHEVASALVLDGRTLAHLEVFANGVDGSTRGTLLEYFGRGQQSPMGERRIRRWLSRPLRSASAIRERQAVVSFFLQPEQAASQALARLGQQLHRLPDLERSIARIHGGRCKVATYLQALDGFAAADAVLDAVCALSTSECPLPPLLHHLCGDMARRPPIQARLAAISRRMDRPLAAQQGRILPLPGADAEYDRLQAAVAASEQVLDAHLQQLRQAMPGIPLRYVELGKDPYVVEVLKKHQPKIPAGAHVRGPANAQVERFVTADILAGVQRRAEALEDRANYERGLLRQELEKFGEHLQEWLALVDVVADVDALVALARASSQLDEPRCLPTVHARGEAGPVLEFGQLRHPYGRPNGAAMIANDVRLASEAPMVLLTGPNMGGKTTLLRQVCLAVVLGQLGACVPAQTARMSLVDRIFSRMGAQDNLLAGQSTFMVELAETSTILRHATRDSLVVLDELGRGTATFDGLAIAHAVVEHLAHHVGCRSLFATHYHMLTDEYAAQKSPARVALRHMACEMDRERGRVVFLYALRDGPCPSSYGMNVARMAAIAEPLVRHAEAVADYFASCLHAQNPVPLDPGVLARLDFAALFPANPSLADSLCNEWLASGLALAWRDAQLGRPIEDSSKRALSSFYSRLKGALL